MTLRCIPLVLAFFILAPGVATALDDSVVRVTTSQDADYAICAPGLLTIRADHIGRIEAIGFEDRTQSWSLRGRSGHCAIFGDGANWKSEGIVRGIVEQSPVLQLVTLFDETCTMAAERDHKAHTIAQGPFAPGSTTFAETACRTFEC
jgi:hypothetical protein